MQTYETEQGWSQDSLPQDSSNSSNSPILNHYKQIINKDKPLGILESNHHSLQPDMLFGWKPKLPSCPLPLKFPNLLIDQIMNLLKKDDRYRIVYKNKHFVSSIQVNQSYDYYWKYRTRYSLNLALVSQAAKQQQIESQIKSHQVNHQSKQINVLHNHNHFEIFKQQKCQYTFDSNFESGNLDLAIRVKPNEYDCFIRSDSNTKGHCNWYYFKITNKQRIGQIKLNICNIAKTKNLYNKGMRPYVLENNKEWTQQACYGVQFVERICRYGTQTKRFQLQFRYNFSKANQQVYIAYGIPYTYSRLQSFVKQISAINKDTDILVVEKLCESLGGVNLPLLKITENASQSQNLSVQTTKKAIIISARIHPGQSLSSLLIQGFIRELLKDDQNYNILRKMFVFYIIPMLNPDGVIVGNYRTSYSGKDLNRQFKDLNNYVFPQISRLHELALEIRQKHFKGIQFYFDFHGHSSKKNLFAYGPQHSPKNIYFFKSRIFAKLIEDFHPIFSYKKSIFKISEGKKKTARAHMLWNLKIPMVYTFQVSNGLYQHKKINYLLNEKILMEGGRSVMKGLFKYVKIQMRIPHNILPSKKSNQTIKKRYIKSSKSIRDTSTQHRNKQSSIRIKDINSNCLQFKSEKLMLSKINNNFAFQNQPITEDNLQEQSNMHYLEEFIGLIDQINNIKPQEDILQGGSDSQSEGEDLEKHETEKLFKAIKNQKLLKSIEPKQHRKPKKNKSTNKLKKPLLQDPNINNIGIINEIKKQLKQQKNNQLNQLLKENKKMKSQMSYGSMITANIRAPTRSPSVIKTSKNLQRSSYQNNGLRTSKQLGRNENNYFLRSNYQTQKVQKVPLIQKSFNLQI